MGDRGTAPVNSLFFVNLLIRVNDYEIGDNMKKMTLFLVLMIVLMTPVLVHATLGSDASSAVADAGFFGLPKPVKAQGFGYTIYKAQSIPPKNSPFPVQPDSISEFVDQKTGAVFGVAWHLSVAPDYLQLLGIDPAQVGKIGLHHSHIQNQKYIIDMDGVPGSCTGRAVRLDLLPKTVSPDIVRP